MLPHIISINISKGGIPKTAVPSIKLTVEGLEGDGHNHAKHYSPLQAVCIQDMEELKALSCHGYTLAPGQAGENLTVANLHVNRLSLGTVLRFSGGVVLEISKVRKPCYVMDVISPQLKFDAVDRHGMYAKVIQEGVLSVGEHIEIQKIPPGGGI